MSTKSLPDNLLLTRKNKTIFQIIFSRTSLIIVLLLLQFLLLFFVFRSLGNYLSLLMGGSVLISAIFVLLLINSSFNPMVKTSWILVVILLPIFGVLLFLFSHLDLGYGLVKHRLEAIEKKSFPLIPQNRPLMDKLRVPETMELHNLANYIGRYGSWPIYENCSIRYFSIGETMFASMLEEMEKAENYIFLEYFILAEGIMWGKMLEILQRKAEAGVEIRLLYDGTCSFSLLPYNYPQQLQRLKIKAKMFAPLRPFLSTHYNNRDHRKILIIDGKAAFTGGINIADEYINQGSRFGHWKDTGILLKGDAVKSFTLMFLQMWNVSEVEPEDFTPFLHDVMPTETGAYVIPYGDSPFDRELLAENVYLDIINRAKKYLYIMTPYLIVDHELLTAIMMAAKRGVDTRMILPHISDQRSIHAIARSYYPELIRSSVKIYEYLPGFAHGKMFLSDDREAVVGTINLDFRSLYHHFECGCYLYESDALTDIKADFVQTMAVSEQMTLERLSQDSFVDKWSGRLLKIFAPLL